MQYAVRMSGIRSEREKIMYLDEKPLKNRLEERNSLQIRGSKIMRLLRPEFLVYMFTMFINIPVYATVSVNMFVNKAKSGMQV